MNSYGEGIAGAAVTLGQPNNFFDANQPTVFFECSAPRLQRLWKKPDFPTFSPHLTVYDGPSLEFAEKLFNVIDSYHYDITCRIKKLSEFVSIGGQSSMVLRLSFNADTIAAIAGEVIAPNEVWHMPETRRLQLIDRLCGHLAHPSAADSLVSTKR